MAGDNRPILYIIFVEYRIRLGQPSVNFVPPVASRLSLYFMPDLLVYHFGRHVRVDPVQDIHRPGVFSYV